MSIACLICSMQLYGSSNNILSSANLNLAHSSSLRVLLVLLLSLSSVDETLEFDPDLSDEFVLLDVLEV